MIRKYGFIKDHPNLNRPMYAALNPDANVELPDEVDLTDKMPPVYDQLSLSSCVANSSAALLQFLNPSITPSRLFIYYNARSLDGDPQQDAGTTMSSAIYTLKQRGFCSENTWKYNENNVLVRPPINAYQEASKDLVIQDFAINTLIEMKQCLAAGFPFGFGFQVYPYFESEQMAESPILPMPQEGDEPIGGHAISAVAYSDKTQMFKIRNSWGPNWGNAGYFYMPYEFITNPSLASDFWTIRKVTIE
jgi:C1A family cysteine protease